MTTIAQSVNSPLPGYVPTETPALAENPPTQTKPPRITSIDAARGFVMLTMIYVNDLAGAPESAHVPHWMEHASDIRPKLPVEDGMTFVDLVFPGFLFILGMSIPFAIGSRLNRGEKWYKILPHILIRGGALLLLGILKTNGAASPKLSGISSAAWITLLFASMFLAFCDLKPFWIKKDDLKQLKLWKYITLGVRIVGFASLLFLIFAWQKTGRPDKTTGIAATQRMVWSGPYTFNSSLSDGFGFGTWYNSFHVRHGWYEILGLLGFSYLTGAILYLIFRNRRLPLLVCMALLLGMFGAERYGAFDNFALPGFLAPLGIAISSVCGFVYSLASTSFGTLPAITVGGIILATILVTPDTATTSSRIKFTLWFIAAASLAAMVFYKPFLIWKNSGTPAWCLWACAITAAVWFLFYLVGDVLKWTWLTKPFAIAGQNVLLAYLLSECLGEVFVWIQNMGWLNIADWYDHIGSPTLTAAVSRSLGFGICLLAITAGLNWLGFRLKL